MFIVCKIRFFSDCILYTNEFQWDFVNSAPPRKPRTSEHCCHLSKWMKGDTQVWQAGGACFEGEAEEWCWFWCSRLPCSPSPACVPLNTLPFRRKPLPSGRKSISLSKPLDNLVTSTGPDFTGTFRFFLPLTKKLHSFKAKFIRTQ